MIVDTAWDALVNAAASALLAAFGVWLWTLTPRTRLTRMLGLFAVAHGVVFVLENLFTFGHLSLPGVLTQVGLAAASWGLLATAREVLRPLGARGLRLWWWAVGAVGGIVVARLLAVRHVVIDPGVAAHPLDLLGIALFTAFMMSTAVLPLVFAWLHRYPPAGQEGRVRRQAPLLSAALVLWPGLWAGSVGLILTFRLGWFGWHGRVAAAAVLGVLLATGALWLANVGASRRHARAARNVAWLVFGLVLFGMVDVLVLYGLLGYSDAGGPFFGLARLAAVVILSYAILKHEVLGFDVRIRWGVSRTTVAAVFIAVFFVVSEAAQQFFGETIGSQYAGIAVAGALVFAISPLQRAAERLAEKAVPAPTAVASGHRSEDARAAAYADAVRLALNAGVTREEEFALARLARELGIDAYRALEIRDAVERQGAPVPVSAAGPERGERP